MEGDVQASQNRRSCHKFLSQAFLSTLLSNLMPSGFTVYPVSFDTRVITARERPLEHKTVKQKFCIKKADTTTIIG